MTVLVNVPADFASEALAGFIGAHPGDVRAVPGGVVRAEASGTGRVAVVMGGGSGHFPAFAGWVGPGFGTAAACGGIFASPSEAQVLRVTRAAHGGAGVLFVPINYAGDILHFTAAANKLRAEGVDARLVAVTDDIASGGPAENSLRRGIAGSFAILKVVGAASEEGRSLDDVESIAIAANAATRSFGVAFSGCTLPGAAQPLFTVPPRRMAVGLGIHGEPGLWEADLGTAKEVADLLIDGLFEERAPEPGRSVALLVNGLGATKYDELHIVFARVLERIDAAGMRAIAPVVGEQMTSLDMAGVSVSLTYLDDDLEILWLRPARTASFVRSSEEARGGSSRAPVPARAAGTPGELDFAPGSRISRGLAIAIIAALERSCMSLEQAEARLGALDSVAGDGDHGSGMLRGARAAARAAREAVDGGAGAGSVLSVAGRAWSDVGGGTSGALWGAGLEAAGSAVGDQAVTDSTAAVAAAAFVAAVRTLGHAELGDKTLLDAALPFANELADSARAGTRMSIAWPRASVIAEQAAASTAQLIARKGRSRVHGYRSLGTPDPGAVSFALIVSGAFRGNT